MSTMMCIGAFLGSLSEKRGQDKIISDRFPFSCESGVQASPRFMSQVNGIIGQVDKSEETMELKSAFNGRLRSRR